MIVSIARHRALVSRIALIGMTGVIVAGTALAQTAPADQAADQQGGMEEIVVTGSHIARTNLETTVPVL